jgi:hypothetical protein
MKWPTLQKSVSKDSFMRFTPGHFPCASPEDIRLVCNFVYKDKPSSLFIRSVSEK